MSDMVERVARAIWLKLSGPEFDDCEEAARAAIEAMREPTPEMYRAIDESDLCRPTSIDAWDLMTKAALGIVEHDFVD